MKQVIDATTRAIRRNILISYVYWHFFEMPTKISEAWGNYLAFGMHLFSVRMLLQTLFYPYRKYRSAKSRGFDPWEFVQNLIFNIFSRAVGFMIRIVLIFAAIIFDVFVFFAGAVIFLSWYILPLLAVISILTGITILAF